MNYFEFKCPPTQTHVHIVLGQMCKR